MRLCKGQWCYLLAPTTGLAAPPRQLDRQLRIPVLASSAYCLTSVAVKTDKSTKGIQALRRLIPQRVRLHIYHCTGHGRLDSHRRLSHPTPLASSNNLPYYLTCGYRPNRRHTQHCHWLPIPLRQYRPHQSGVYYGTSNFISTKTATLAQASDYCRR